MLTPSQSSPDPEPSFAVSAIVTFLPLVLLLVMFVPVLLVLRRNIGRAEESLGLLRQTVAELKAIRAVLERPDTK